MGLGFLFFVTGLVGWVAGASEVICVLRLVSYIVILMLKLTQYGQNTTSCTSVFCWQVCLLIPTVSDDLHCTVVSAELLNHIKLKNTLVSPD